MFAKKGLGLDEALKLGLVEVETDIAKIIFFCPGVGLAVHKKIFSFLLQDWPD